METLNELRKAPNFTLQGSDEKFHSLEDYLEKNIVLYFYPKDNTPGCTTEALDFKANMSTFNNLDTIVLGISKDNYNSHCRFVDKNELNFILLSDVDKEVCSLYNVLKEKNMYGKKTIGIERSTFVINKEGFISKEFRKVKVANHVNEVIDFIKNNL